eukprot:6469876-Amphidinium_carterae.1
MVLVHGLACQLGASKLRRARLSKVAAVLKTLKDNRKFEKRHTSFNGYLLPCWLSKLDKFLNRSPPGSAWAGVLSQGPKGGRLISRGAESLAFIAGQRLQKCTWSALWKESKPM